MACMYKGAWRLFFHPALSIREQMAWDETLLQGVGENGPAVCFYAIRPVTISLGVFQKVEATFIPEKFSEYAATFVRRPTGGQALLHKDALVFSLIVARGHFEPFRKRELYLAFAPLFVAALTALGIPARINLKSKTGSDGQSARPHPHCFAGAGEYEIVSAAGKKLIGSAQIITREGCLQQNFIPLDNGFRELEDCLLPGPTSPSACRPVSAGNGGPEAASLTEAAGRPVAFAQVQAALVAAFGQKFHLGPGSFSGKETELMQRLLAEKYAHEQWNYRY